MKMIEYLITLRLSLRTIKVIWLLSSIGSLKSIINKLKGQRSVEFHKFLVMDIHCDFHQIINNYDPDLIFIENIDPEFWKAFISVGVFETITGTLDHLINKFRAINLKYETKIDRHYNKDKRFLSFLKGLNFNKLDENDPQSLVIKSNLLFVENSDGGVPVFYNKKNKLYSINKTTFDLSELISFSCYGLISTLNTEGFLKGSEMIFFPIWDLNIESDIDLVYDVSSKYALIRIPPSIFSSNRRISNNGYSIRLNLTTGFNKKKLVCLSMNSLIIQMRDYLDNKMNEIGEVKLSDKGIYSKITLKGISPVEFINKLMTLDLMSLIFHICFQKTRSKTKNSNKVILNLEDENLKPLVSKNDSKLSQILNMGLFDLGIELRCNLCRNRSFYYLEEVGNEFTCERCNSVSQINYLPHWHLKLNDSTFLFFINNSDINIFCLSKIITYFDLNRTQYEYEIEFVYPDLKCEIDFLFEYDGYLGIGETKLNDGSLVTKDINKLKHFISILRPKFLAIGLGNDCNDDNCISSIHTDGSKIFSKGIHKKICELESFSKRLMPGFRVFYICRKNANFLECPGKKI